nr:arrestin domain-containing protein 17-like isoform X1 [Procambarus clarkii]
MGINKFDVVLEPGQRAYVSGQDVVGRVVVWADSVTSCRAILVKSKGYAKVEWGEESPQNSEEVYFENIVTIWSGTSHGDNLPAGEYGFPFQFKLPPKIPRSFEGTYGHIRYVIEAKAEIPWGTDQLSSVFFNVECKYDLSEHRTSSDSLMFHKEQSVCCCCCEQGPVIISLCAEKTDYIPGEYVLLTGEVTNRAGWHIESAEITLHETITYKINEATKIKREILQRVRRPGILTGETDIWLSVPIHIPDSAVCLQYCSIMTALYAVKITFSMGFCSTASVKQNITIGTVPVGKVSMTVEGAPASPTVPIPSAPPLYSTLDTPSHEMQPILHQPTSSPDLSKAEEN